MARHITTELLRKILRYLLVFKALAKTSTKLRLQ